MWPPTGNTRSRHLQAAPGPVGADPAPKWFASMPQRNGNPPRYIVGSG
jgi:hypothetical protein